MNNLYRNYMSLLLLLLTMSTDLFARAGGGGGSGSEKESASAAVIAGILYAIYRIRRARMIIQAKKQFAKANASDPSWNLDHFQETAGNIFYLYQEAWMEKNLQLVGPYFYPDYLKKSQRDMDLKLRGKKNILQNISLNSVELMSVLDVKGQEGDMFVLELNFTLIDYTIDEKTGKFLDSPLQRGEKESLLAWRDRAQHEANKSIEYWVFYRLSGKWVLYNIHQVDSIIGDLGHASVRKLKKILAEEKAKPKDAAVDDTFFYKKEG